MTFLKNIMQTRKLKVILFSLVLFLAMLVRLWKMEYIPFQNDGDELAYVFTGLSLFDLGYPVSWSSFEYGEDRIHDVVLLGEERLNTAEEFTLVGPWYDNPYLLSVIQGGWLKLMGYSHPSTPPSLIIRIPMLLFALITLIYIFKIGYKFFGYYPALTGLILIGFSPSLILGHRMVAAENVYISLTLVAIYHLINTKKHNLFVLIILTVLAALAKFPGLICLIIVATYFLTVKQYKKLVSYTLGSITLFLFSYLLYAVQFDFQHFLTMLEIQSHRLVGFSNPAFIFSHPGFLNFTLDDFSYYLIIVLGLAGFILKTQSKHEKIIKTGLISSLIMLWATSAEQDMLGWYKLPFFTFLTILSMKIVKKGNLATITSLLVITVINNLGLIRFPESPLPDTNLLRFLLIIIFIITIGGIYLKRYLKNSSDKQLTNIKVITFVSLLIIYSGYSFYFAHRYYYSLCKDKACKIPAKTLTSIVRDHL